MKCSTAKYCITSEYSGEVASYERSDNSFNSFQFFYRIPSNSTTLYEEYWVYDGINTIGSVGGTLGMCIGFSFTGLLSYLIKILQHATFIFKTKLADRKFTKPKPKKYRSLEIENNIKPNVNVSSRKQIYNERYSRNEIEIFIEKMLDEKMDKKLEGKIGKILEEKFKYKNL